MTRERAPTSPPVVLTVAGSDSGGGAGIQADLKTIEAGGAFGTSVLTSVTAQHTRGVESTHLLPLEEITAQYEAVASDFDVAALKTGMLATRAVVEFATERIAAQDAPAVVDPVMVAASGDRLLDPGAESAYEELAREATLLTPNADEAEVLTGLDIETTADAVAAAEQLVDDGVDAVLLKGGHVSGEVVVDVLVTGDRVERIRHPRVETDATHGSGCTLSSAIATRLAHGDDLHTAVQRGIDLLARAVRYSLDVGEGPGAVHHTVELRDRADREPTAEAVREVVREFVARDISPLVPAGGTDVVGATPYAETPAECAGVEGGLARGIDGIATRGAVRFGASDGLARVLLAARESDPDLRFAVTCRYGDDIAAALESLDWPRGEYASSGVPDPGDGGDDGEIERTVADLFERSEGTPTVLVDPGRHGVEPTTTLLSRDPETLVERTATLLETVD
jgi:hydroxymethylpyrimidine/phosphomethylpyrimidine kinase